MAAPHNNCLALYFFKAAKSQARSREDNVIKIALKFSCTKRRKITS